MRHYYLTDLNKEKIPEISNLVEEFGLKTDTIEKNRFTSQFTPNHWYTGGIRISAYNEKHPVHIATTFEDEPLDEDPNFDLITRVVKHLGSRTAVDDAGDPYDLSIFRKTYRKMYSLLLEMESAAQDGNIGEVKLVNAKFNVEFENVVPSGSYEANSEEHLYLKARDKIMRSVDPFFLQQGISQKIALEEAREAVYKIPSNHLPKK